MVQRAALQEELHQALEQEIATRRDFVEVQLAHRNEAQALQDSLSRGLRMRRRLSTMQQDLDDKAEVCVIHFAADMLLQLHCLFARRQKLPMKMQWWGVTASLLWSPPPCALSLVIAFHPAWKAAKPRHNYMMLCCR